MPFVLCTAFLNVCTKRSVSPLVHRCYAELVVYRIPLFLQNLRNSTDTNCLSLSETICSGISNLTKQSLNFSIIFLLVVSACIYFESLRVRLHDYQKLIFYFLKVPQDQCGAFAMEIAKGAKVGGSDLLAQQFRQLFTISFIFLSILGHHMNCLASAFIFTIPACVSWRLVSNFC